MVNLEELPERYTVQWAKWFREELRGREIEYTDIAGDQLTSSVETGKVLDAAGTNYFKFSQLQTICTLFREGIIKDGDKFFIADMWFPGLEAIPYMAQLYNKKIDIYGFLHAGSYTDEDFAQPMQIWAKYFERGWHQLCTKVFVGSEYHKEKFYDKRLWKQEPSIWDIEGKDKIIVTGNPFKSSVVLDVVKGIKKERQVIFPNRFDKEKRPLMFLELVRDLKHTDIKFVVTTSRNKLTNDNDLMREAEKTLAECPNFTIKVGLTKEEYYQELGKSKVFFSPTIEENFGYCLIESLLASCIPVVRKDFSHIEILGGNEKLMFEYYHEAREKVLQYVNVDKPVTFAPLAMKYDKSIENILKEMEVI